LRILITDCRGDKLGYVHIDTSTSRASHSVGLPVPSTGFGLRLVQASPVRVSVHGHFTRTTQRVSSNNLKINRIERML